MKLNQKIEKVIRTHPWCTGIFITSTYLLILHPLFQNSQFYSPLTETDITTDRSSRNILLFYIVSLCATLNVLSHAAVVLLVLDDALVLSILIGVGFDVFSQVAYIAMWMVLSINITQCKDVNDYCAIRLYEVSFTFILLASSGYHLHEHVVALQLYKTHQRLKTVVRSALNNLIGQPGYYGIDHFFAYTDLGSHFFHLLVSSLFLGTYRAVKLVLVILFFVIIGNFLHINRSSPSGMRLSPNNDKITLQVNAKGKPICACSTCRKNGSFIISVKDRSLCKLWFYSFRDLLKILDKIES